MPQSPSFQIGQFVQRKGAPPMVATEESVTPSLVVFDLRQDGSIVLVDEHSETFVVQPAEIEAVSAPGAA